MKLYVLINNGLFDNTHTQKKKKKNKKERKNSCYLYKGFDHVVAGRPVVATLMHVIGNVPSIVLPYLAFSCSIIKLKELIRM